MGSDLNTQKLPYEALDWIFLRELMERTAQEGPRAKALEVERWIEAMTVLSIAMSLVMGQMVAKPLRPRMHQRKEVALN